MAGLACATRVSACGAEGDLVEFNRIECRAVEFLSPIESPSEAWGVQSSKV